MVKKLLLNGWSKKRMCVLAITQIIGFVIIILSLHLFFELRQGQQEERSKEYLIITKKVNMLRNLVNASSGFTKKEINELEMLKGVDHVGTFTAGKFKVQARVGVGGEGNSIMTDIFFESVEEEYLDINVAHWEFDPEEGNIPIIVPQNYMNLYNFGFAPSVGLPRLSKEVIQKVSIDITLFGSDGERHAYTGKIAGFSARLNTILVPQELIEWGNTHLANGAKEHPQRLVVAVDPSHSDEVVTFIQNENYELENTIANYSKMNRLARIILSATLFIGLVIALLSILLLLLSSSLLIERNKEQIKNLLILGYSYTSIIKPYRQQLFRMVTGSFILALFAVVFLHCSLLSSFSNELAIKLLSSPFGASIITVLMLYAFIIILLQIALQQSVKRVAQLYIMNFK